MPAINGTNGDDDLDGTGASDTMNGKGGSDTLRGLGGNDSIGGDNFLGPFGDDELFGGDGEDKLFGQGGDDRLFGGKHDDYLEGRGDDDRLAGNLGADELVGGEGSDTFAFEKIQDSLPEAGFDVIVDFDPGVDRLDVSQIDANAGKNGNQQFTFKGEGDGTFTAAGEVEYASFHGNTLVWLNNDADSGRDSAILLKGVHDLSVSDFVL